MVTKPISENDVQFVAGTIFNRVLTPEQVAIVLERYPSAEEEDPGATWNLIVENIIHQIFIEDEH